ncbi:hypothetical protein HR060_17030 [Catenovulum sp. SM1970]|uniref:hypothetical protein n=1 Tax=Marinifaba aquimaris TaxID=2741323 RepID=UPI0015720822|nr:hypothetical protein [Marinifaba aquimaris]NTS78549.1 hypothetical protein [Marinifaba aquimaris]
MKLTLLLMLSAVLFSNAALAKWAKPQYIKHYCDGYPQHKLADNLFVDCLTKTHAVDFIEPEQWQAAIGSVFYKATMTNKKPALMIISDKSDAPSLKQITKTIENHNLPLDIWTVSPAKMTIVKVDSEGSYDNPTVTKRIDFSTYNAKASQKSAPRSSSFSNKQSTIKQHSQQKNKLPASLYRDVNSQSKNQSLMQSRPTY